MEIIKSNLFRPRKCAFGDFELKAEKGWKVSQSFIDYESGLLVVTESCEDKSEWTDNGYNGWSIPTKEYIIHLDTLKILEFDEWKNYFNYDKTAFVSEDNKYKLITQRIHEQDRNSDGIKEELFEIESNRLISSSYSLAFRQDKGENLLESHYRSIREREEQKRVLDAKPNLKQFYSDELSKLKENEVIIAYMDNSNAHKLVFFSNKFMLFKSDQIPAENETWKSMEFSLIKEYPDLEAFWTDFTKEEKWFVKYSIHQSISEKPLVLAKHIILYFNDLRKQHDFTYTEYDRLHTWENSVWSEKYKKTEIKQWCANCFKEVNYQARYPKYICSDCSAKEKVDMAGNLLAFSNLGFSGGFKIIRKNRDGHIIEEDDTKQFCDCIIDGKEFFAQEARFGGIVIQRKE